MLKWRSSEATVESLSLGITDSRLLELAKAGDKIGIDVPFGWPGKFVQAISAHHARQPWCGGDSCNLRLRQTDMRVWQAIRKQPLSVSTDKIGIPALRMAALIVKLEEMGTPVDRTGAGRFVEVCPAAALRRWGIADTKKDTPGFLPALLAQAPWLRITDASRALCAASRDSCDALVAALAARAAAIGECDPIPEKHMPMAALEGWIALPFVGSLCRLLGAQAASA